MERHSWGGMGSSTRTWIMGCGELMDLFPPLRYVLFSPSVAVSLIHPLTLLSLSIYINLAHFLQQPGAWGLSLSCGEECNGRCAGGRGGHERPEVGPRGEGQTVCDKRMGFGANDSHRVEQLFCLQRFVACVIPMQPWVKSDLSDLGKCEQTFPSVLVFQKCTSYLVVLIFSPPPHLLILCYK